MAKIIVDADELYPWYFMKYEGDGIFDEEYPLEKGLYSGDKIIEIDEYLFLYLKRIQEEFEVLQKTLEGLFKKR